MDAALKHRIDACRQDYQSVTGRTFEHFYCPILRRDEDSPLCMGHVVNKDYGDCWVPQRRDVDNFYGSVVESDMIAILRDRNLDPTAIWLDPERRRQHRPRVEVNGISLDHYFLRDGQSPPDGHAVGGIVLGDSEQTYARVAFKYSVDEMSRIAPEGFQIVVERDYRPPVVASLIKATHLSLFKMLGYEHVFSPTGDFLAGILSDFFVANKHIPKRDLRAAIDQHFLRWSNMTMPLAIKDDGIFAGTAVDNRVLICCGMTRFFALGVIIRLGKDLFCTFVPTDDVAIDTFFTFLKEPAKSIAVRLGQFCPADENGGARWEVCAGDPIRVFMPHANVELPDWAQEKIHGRSIARDS